MLSTHTTCNTAQGHFLPPRGEDDTVVTSAKVLGPSANTHPAAPTGRARAPSGRGDPHRGTTTHRPSLCHEAGGLSSHLGSPPRDPEHRDAVSPMSPCPTPSTQSNSPVKSSQVDGFEKVDTTKETDVGVESPTVCHVHRLQVSALHRVRGTEALWPGGAGGRRDQRVPVPVVTPLFVRAAKTSESHLPVPLGIARTQGTSHLPSSELSPARGGATLNVSSHLPSSHQDVSCVVCQGPCPTDTHRIQTQRRADPTCLRNVVCRFHGNLPPTAPTAPPGCKLNSVKTCDSAGRSLPI